MRQHRQRDAAMLAGPRLHRAAALSVGRHRAEAEASVAGSGLRPPSDHRRARLRLPKRLTKRDRPHSPWLSASTGPPGLAMWDRMGVGAEKHQMLRGNTERFDGHRTPNRVFDDLADAMRR